jgi:16S rRNA (guanine966-N2)-methyltransferase
MLQSRLGSFEGLHVADLFAGTGALGLEALSRGAGHCTFVESDRGALAILQQNVDRFGAGERATLRAQPVEHVSAPTRPCDLVLMDPPYARGLAEAALKRLTDPAWLRPGAMVSIETEARLPPPPGFALEAERRFGKAHITLLRRSD